MIHATSLRRNGATTTNQPRPSSFGSPTEGAGLCVVAGVTAFVRTLPVLACLLVGLAANAVFADAVLMEFSSDHCPPCRAMQPIVSELIARGVPVRQVDVQAEPQLTQRFQVRSTPTYVILRDGKEVTRLMGTQSINQLRAALQQNTSGPLVPTRSEFGAANQSRPASMPEPLTRLAPMAGNAPSLASAPSRSVRRDFGQDNQAMNGSDWRSLESDRSGTNAGNEFLTSANPASDISMEAMPSTSLADAVERAQAATVRLRVYDGRGYGAGTGTIIDVHGDEALVLTCGHLFRDGDGKDKIEVDVFVGGEPHTVTGYLVDFDAGDRDIGLVAIRPGIDVQAVDVIRENENVRVGQTAFSFGCDRGDDPSRRDTRITGVDKYNQNIGGSNLEISGAPIDGRSGGGLFDERGRLIGVCNAADYKSDIGIYTGPGSIKWQLDRVKLSRLYEAQPGAAVASLADNRSTSPASRTATASSPAAMTFNPEAMAASGLGTSGMGAEAGNLAAAGATEMIVIIRDRNGEAREQVLTLSQPDARLVQQIRQAARR
ncbi:Thioredoxin [Neorhodopirellula lusitana]|uniref:Thioredoxin n=1 Tax=Neorhodopirellula lusitana TaxID=445327 RepID=A0ABY1PNT1_9BACT|nr:trypsin-like peptidase domain-containing protein [Neorhodopirellula lusitana]SMP39357.1 Thioredoxin [Neorhodopirellula lusitana]